jgi:hypothetical protein
MSKRKTPPVAAGHKWCLGCEAGLPIGCFEVNPRSPDGHRPRCHPCLQEQRAEQLERRMIVRAAAERMIGAGHTQRGAFP